MAPNRQVIADGQKPIIYMKTKNDYRPLLTRQDLIIRAAILGETQLYKKQDYHHELMHDFLIFNPYSDILNLTKTSPKGL